jgi:hypothetical protein
VAAACIPFILFFAALVILASDDNNGAVIFYGCRLSPSDLHPNKAIK